MVLIPTSAIDSCLLFHFSFTIVGHCDRVYIYALFVLITGRKNHKCLKSKWHGRQLIITAANPCDATNKPIWRYVACSASDVKVDDFLNGSFVQAVWI